MGGNDNMDQVQRLSANKIKYILIIAMVIDHIAWGFVPKDNRIAWQLMHFFGRLTGPGMAFFLVQGYLHTHNFAGYAKRLFLFGVLSCPFFLYFEFGFFTPVRILTDVSGLPAKAFVFPSDGAGRYIVFYPYFGVIYTLFLSLIMLRVFDDKRLSETVKILSFIGLYLLSYCGDWPGIHLLFTFVFYRFRDNKKLMWIMYCLVGLLSFEYAGFKLDGIYQAGVFLVPLLMACYNGKRGSTAPFHKWFFYVFYPLHLLILGLARWM